jgi:hypothetical protein
MSMNKCAAAILGMGLLSTAHAQVLDQSQEVQFGGISVNNSEHVAQSFMQGTNLPFLAAIWVGDFEHPSDSYPLDITLEIRNGVGTDPTGFGLIHTEDFTVAGAPADGWYKFVLALPVALTPTINYTFILKGAAGNTGTTVLGFNPNPSYGGVILGLSTSNNVGVNWNASPGFNHDLTFRTYSWADFPVMFDRATLKDSTSMCFISEVGKVYNLQATTDKVNFQGWEDVGASVPGNGGVTYLFDPTEPTGSSTSKAYRISGSQVELGNEIPLGFRVLGTMVPPYAENPSLHGFTQEFPSTNITAPAFTTTEQARGYVTYVKHYMDTIYPRTNPQRPEITDQLTMFSVAGEYEPATFAIYALPGNELDDISVYVGDLTGPAGRIIKSTNIEIRSVRCWPRVRGESIYAVVPWFLEKRATLDIPSDTSQRYWLTVYAPADTAAGTYAGLVTVHRPGHDPYTLDLALEVPDIQLETPPMQQGMYYNIMNHQQPSGVFSYYPDEYYYKEVMNMKEHGMTTVWLFNPEFTGYVDGMGDVVYDLDPIAPFVDACMLAGFDPLIWNMTIGSVLPGYTGPSSIKGENFKGFVDSYLARGWTQPILSHGDETDARPAFYQTCLDDLAASKQYVPAVTTYTTIVYPNHSEWFEPDLDTRVFSSHMDNTAIGPTRAAGKQLWMYSGADRGTMINRINRGWFAAATTLDGMMAWVYYGFPADPALPFDDLVSGIRGCVVPGVDGPLPTPDWEGFREGVEDRKYIFTLEELIQEADHSGDAGLMALAASARIDLDALYAQIYTSPIAGQFPVSYAAGLLSLDFCDDARRDIAGHIEAIQNALMP